MLFPPNGVQEKLAMKVFHTLRVTGREKKKKKKKKKYFKFQVWILAYDDANNWKVKKEHTHTHTQRMDAHTTHARMHAYKCTQRTHIFTHG